VKEGLSRYCEQAAKKGFELLKKKADALKVGAAIFDRSR
jgi:hypothetical protein